ncbi:hypothetical protein MCAP1_003254 [Malassezia caprae]|uniref:Autophagy-related protein 101 n=1 Tax=Malassezia caprae TaxID=1381934 RepID=A0AAF0E9W2_9BASI|nr:hypothetical protein MCAP1_003254 [Malassezia caprae]
MQVATRIPIYTHEQTVARESAPCVLEAMLHVICFVRLLGHLSPATHRIGGVELPVITDEAVAAHLREAVKEIFARLDEQGHAGRVCVDVVVGWHKTAPTTKERVVRPASPDRTSPAPAGKHYAVFHSPYSWLASALAGTRQGKADERPNQLLTRDAAHDEAAWETFEQWVLSLQVHYEARASTPDLQPFATTALAFANTHQAQLPAILDAGLCPFPFTIDSTVRA